MNDPLATLIERDAAETWPPLGMSGLDLRRRSSRRALRRAVLAGTGVVALAVAVGVGATTGTWSGHNHEPAPGEGESPAIDSRFDDLNLFADSLRESSDRTVWAAREKALTSCLEGVGIRYEASAYPGGPVSHSRLAVPNLGSVRAFGYDWATAISATKSFTPTTVPDSAIVPRDTCNLRVLSELGEDSVNRLRDTIDQANQALSAKVLASPIYIDTLQRWADCMTSAGYRYQTPAMAAQAGAWMRGTGDRPAQEAIDIAVADYGCQRDVQLDQVLHDGFADGVADWVSANTATIDKYESAVRAMVAKAEAILSN